ncbi:MAG: serine/threonine-protein kinase [Ktedonobacteraceae bacterium]
MREQHGPIKEQHGSGFNALSRGQVIAYPHRFGNYDLERRIDVGGMGEVYLARQRSAFDREVAIKIIRSDLVHDMTARRRFLREAEVNAHIKHEHILSLYEFGEEQGRLFLVTPYIAGGTLSRRLQKGPMTLSEVHQIFTALVQAVAYIHRRGVVHRDLKPSNILLDSEENSDRVYVRLIDFGIATIQGMAASPPLTTAGTEMGTLAYMAPERMSGIAAPSNDIFSLGIILHQMLTGVLPGSQTGRPGDEPKATLPKPLAYVVNRSIAPRLEERFATAEELLEAFEDAYQLLITAEEEVVSSVQRTGANRTNTVTRRRVERAEEESDTGRINGNIRTEGRTAIRVDTLSPAPQKPATFIEADYAAPTVNFAAHSFAAQGVFDVDALQTGPPLKPNKPPVVPRTKKRRNPIVAIVTVLIVVVLLVMASLLYFGLQTVIAPTANINIAPKVEVVQAVYHITAQPLLKTSNLATASIPAELLNENKVASLSGTTTGLNCPFPPFRIGCQQTVQESDVSNIAIQLRQTLQAQISTDLQHQLQMNNGTAIGTIQFADEAVTSNPAVGASSKTVSVSMTEQGSLNYYKAIDAQNMARQLLQQQVQKLGPNHLLLNSSVDVGQPAITAVNNTGVVLSVAAGGDVQYQISSLQLHDIANHLKSMKVQAALAYIKHQSGIDPASVKIHLSTGDTMPGNTQQITIIPINQTTIPPFNLPTVMPITIPTTTSTPQTTTATP